MEGGERHLDQKKKSLFEKLPPEDVLVIVFNNLRKYMLILCKICLSRQILLDVLTIIVKDRLKLKICMNNTPQSNFLETLRAWRERPSSISANVPFSVSKIWVSMKLFCISSKSCTWIFYRWTKLHCLKGNNPFYQ